MSGSDRRLRGGAWAAIVVGVLALVGAGIAFHFDRSAPSDAGQLPVAVGVSTGVSPVATAAATPTAASASTAAGPATQHTPPVAASATATDGPGSATGTGPADPESARPSGGTATRPPATTTRPAAGNGIRPAPRPTGAAATTRGSAATDPASARSGAGASAPAVLELPSLKVTADVGPVDSVDGVLQVPDDVGRVGWWVGSSPAGAATGSTVIDGHIDSADQGEGALFHLADLGPGDPVTVRTAAGSTIRYTVAARRVYVKAQGLPADIFTDPGYPRLVLISCGGSFDSAERSYTDNIVVYATPTT